MKSNRASTSSGPSPTFTYSTTHTVPRPSPLLSSSFTPFYPQSRQQVYGSQLDPLVGQDTGCYISPQDLNGSGVHESYSYEWLGPSYYKPKCYPSSGSESYKAPWVSNGGDVWSGGTCWQWGESAPEEYLYADDDAEDSAYLHSLPSGSLSYHAGSPVLEQELYACSWSNTAPVRTAGPDRGSASFITPRNTSLLESSPEIKRHLTPIVKDSFIQGQAAPFSSGGRKATVKCTSNEVSNVSVSNCKPDAKPSLIQVPSQIGSLNGGLIMSGNRITKVHQGITSQPIEPKLKQSTTCTLENIGDKKDGIKSFTDTCGNAPVEHGTLDASVSNPSNPAKLLAEINVDPPTMAISAEVIQKEVDSRNNSSLQSSSSPSIATSGQCSGITIPTHTSAQAYYSSLVETGDPLDQRNIGWLADMALPVLETESKPCIKAINHEPPTMHQDTMDSISLLYLNGPQLLVKCIHNLSKVLVSCQSGTAENILDPNDCFAIENTICMLSHRLSQFSINEANSCHDQNCHQVADKEFKTATDMLHLPNEQGSSKASQQGNSYFMEGATKREAMTFYPSRVLEKEVLDGLSRVPTSNSSDLGNERVAYQSSCVREKESRKPWQDLVMLRCNITRLQEEVAYERIESNAAVMTYKKLWSEAEEALKVSKSEIQTLKAELASLKQDFLNLKRSGAGGLGSIATDLEQKSDRGALHENLIDTVSSSNQCFTEQDMGTELDKERCSSVCGRSKDWVPACHGGLVHYNDPGNTSNYVENRTCHVKGEEVIGSHNHQSGKVLKVSTSEHPSMQVAEPSARLEDEVTRRLSLLLSRQSLDLNKTCFDGDTISEASTKLRRDCDAVPPDSKEDYSIFSDTSYNVNSDQAMGGTEAESSWQSQPAVTIAHGMVKKESNARRLNCEGMKVNAYPEDEMEIICLRPSLAESSFGGLKEEPDGEHVVVNALDHRKASRHKESPMHRRTCVENRVFVVSDHNL